MSKKKICAVIVCLLCAILSNFLIIKYVRLAKAEEIKPAFNVEMVAEKTGSFQLFYNSDVIDYSENRSSYYDYNEEQKKVVASFNVEYGYPVIRFDMGNEATDVKISRMYLAAYGVEYDIPLDSFFSEESVSNDVDSLQMKNGMLMISTQNGDPYIECEYKDSDFLHSVQRQIDRNSRPVNIFFCIIIDIIILFAIKYMNRLKVLPLEIYNDRKLVFNLARNDFKTKYAGSYLGIIWAFIQPVVTVVVYWFVFQVGLRAGRMCNYPFILFLMSGLVPWFFFSDALNGGTTALIEYNYLVKKVVFKISILPIVKTISAIFVHLFFVVFVSVICACYGYSIDIYNVQIIYYMICNVAFVLGLAYFTSAVVCFFRDLTQIIAIVLQVGMWMTPIMWDAASTLPSKVNMIFKLNPMYYIVDGYRDSLLAKVWFWEKMPWTICFWVAVIILFSIGVTVFKKLRVHFADVL